MLSSSIQVISRSLLVWIGIPILQADVLWWFQSHLQIVTVGRNLGLAEIIPEE